jgi:phage terminase small subunit
MTTSQDDLTEQQQKFVDALFDTEATAGDFAKANAIAGYAGSSTQVLQSKAVQKAIIARTEQYIAANGPKAAINLISLLDKPTTKSAKIVLDSARDILDRAGVVKKSETELVVTAPNAIIVLPPKNNEPTQE